MLRLCCDTQMCSAFCFACGRETGKQYDARVDTVRHLQAGWNWLNCFRGPQGIVLLEMLRCFFFQFVRPLALKMRKTVLLDIYLLCTAESCLRRIPATGCQGMKFSEENRSFTASAMLWIFLSLFHAYLFFSFLACFSFILVYPFECGVGGAERVIRMA